MGLARQATALHSLRRVSECLGIDLWAKRDDLYPLTGGGNKARKIGPILAEADAASCNALVTTGGTQSNHARVVALVAAQEGWRCGLILHGSECDLAGPKGNLLLMQLSGADIEIVSPSEIAEAMREKIRAYREVGLTPFEVPGGGHTVAGSLAYVDAVRELRDQCQQVGWCPEYIVHASGTGTTQAGLVAGLQCLGWNTQVLGVSVARRNPRGEAVVQEAYRDVCARMGLSPQPERIRFLDGWIGNGYEHATINVLEAIRFAARTEGLILDPTYTGKAFAAMNDIVGSGTIHRGAKVLFWHTGGLPNLLATDYFAIKSKL